VSCIYKGEIVDTNLSKNARGGTEMMRARLLNNVPMVLLQDVAIHFSRPREMYSDVKNIMYCHDLALDPENKILENGGWQKFSKFVFVSYWQRDQYILIYKIPYSRCTVIENAVELQYKHVEKATDEIRFIYHTTPHRGLELLYPIFDGLSKDFDNVHLDVYSSFKVYGWESRDEPYKPLFEKLSSHPKITYHGSKSNEEVLGALQKSHIFLYPNIWQETSCIAMIEAIKSSCMVIHPSYAALPETANGATVMYDYHENPSVHANVCYQVVKQILDIQKKYPHFINTFTAAPSMELKQNNIEVFASKWKNLLERLKHE
jgi:UDP-glucose:(glucosyl)LPS alpha-1,2-glucosyltransferase